MRLDQDFLSSQALKISKDGDCTACSSVWLSPSRGWNTLPHPCHSYWLLFWPWHMLSIRLLSTTSVQAVPSHRKLRVFPSFRVFPEELIPIYHSAPIICKPSYHSCYSNSVVVTAQGVLVPPACSPSCHTFVFVHFRWVPVHKVLLFLRSLLFLSPCILFSQSMSTSCLA